MFDGHRIITPEVFARRMVELLPAYQPGMDTGSADPTDRRACWNKSLASVLTVMGREVSTGIVVETDTGNAPGKQLTMHWKQGDGIVFAAATGWGDRSDVEGRFVRLETLKAPQKLFVYTCSKWQEAVLEQISAVLLRYPHHLGGEQYLIANLLGAEQKVHVYLAEFRQDGPQGRYRPDTLRPITGSPFSWRNRKLTAAS
jgi:hypothetical protein